MSGGAGGLLSAVILQPADLLKTRIQQPPPPSSATAAATATHAAPASVVATIRSISSGPAPIRQLWRGTLPSAIRTGVGSAMYFSTLNTLRSALAPSSSSTGSTRAAASVSATGAAGVAGTGAHATGAGSSSSSSSLPQLPPWANLLSGAAARAAIGYVVMPVTVIKVRYESTLYSYQSLADACTDIFRTEGVRGFFSGWGATAVRDAPYAGLYVLFYEQAKASLGAAAYGRSPAAAGGPALDDNTAMVVNACAGAAAAAAATAVTNPFDTLKTRIQVDPDKYRNMWTALQVVWREEAGGRRWRGRALFDGLGLRVARKAVSSALAWGLYERMVR